MAAEAWLWARALGALLLVLALVGALSWGVVRLRHMRPGGQGGIHVRSVTMVGPKEKLALVEVEGQRLLLGVTPSCISLLMCLDDAASGAGVLKQDDTQENFSQAWQKALEKA